MEQISRRRFFHLGGATAAAAAVPAFSGLSELQRPPLQWRARTAAEMPQPELEGRKSFWMVNTTPL